mmetsp:Transcript_18601/g.60109  ORF Transcript_18601/g.60109 Transcript_18601/m.60109 type:complete len:276 (-) Transcript_18601:119-946(-)
MGEQLASIGVEDARQTSNRRQRPAVVAPGTDGGGRQPQRGSHRFVVLVVPEADLVQRPGRRELGAESVRAGERDPRGVGRVHQTDTAVECLGGRRFYLRRKRVLHLDISHHLVSVRETGSSGGGRPRERTGVDRQGRRAAEGGVRGDDGITHAGPRVAEGPSFGNAGTEEAGEPVRPPRFVEAAGPEQGLEGVEEAPGLDVGGPLNVGVEELGESEAQHPDVGGVTPRGAGMPANPEAPDATREVNPSAGDAAVPVEVFHPRPHRRAMRAKMASS